ncbi:MAG: bifunctional 2-C-methyl-D-erythritol 4-phosphate cytidylyltransferase/2-C-methyl-D-erythritol 2,4-cyclodiphosphate synthase [Rhodobacteraceae bacterium]|nr:bifunctional 2-C-methyl-D-erythritol 4-phosphate cytidylyltransferase/2-C-methyl-D-erythritol 2,4-cyclodiphosphate synthase [Paracoccaceae bacterium]
MTSDRPKTAAIIVAAGRGTRVGGPIPKQWRMLCGQRVAQHTLNAFRSHAEIDIVLIVHHKDDVEEISGLLGDAVLATPGGATRDASVRAGLEALVDAAPERVLIHDAARPLVSAELISEVIAATTPQTGAAPALAVTDALWKGDGDHVTGTADRTGLFRAQTPQGFDFASILTAHRENDAPAADDVEIARRAGVDVKIVPGDERNLKITTEADFERAAKLMDTAMDVRLGNGYDVHRFGPGTSVWLCGVEVPHTRALQGHSDADVGMHAVTDALYGALAEGDIGRHFPPSDPQWKGAASHIFLSHAAQLVTQKGFTISNVDCTLVCEFPKIGPHAERMIETMASIMGIEKDRMSVKATTSERLGFTGREEGIAAIATATLVKS